jgi:hypothetical protein
VVRRTWSWFRAATVARSPYEGLEQTKKIIWDAESELWLFLLGHRETPGRAEFHVVLTDEIREANYLASPRLNAYMSRTLDGDCLANETGTVGVYAKILKVVSLVFLTAPDPAKERWEGTRVFEQGTLRTPQHVESESLIPFIKQRTAVIEKAIAALPAREQERGPRLFRPTPSVPFRQRAIGRTLPTASCNAESNQSLWRRAEG